jgi:ATPase family associated with various cellular activities (AAA)
MEPMPKALDRVYEALRETTRPAGTGETSPDVDEGPRSAPPGSPAAATEPWTALDQLTTLFGLTSFERDVVVLLTGYALEARFARACAEPTLGLALAALDEPHLSVLSTARPLRYWQLLSLGPGRSALHSPVTIDERVLAFLLGLPALDERLSPFCRPLRAAEGSGAEAGNAEAVAAGARHWTAAAGPGGPLLLIAAAAPVRERAFTAICAACDLLPYAVDGADIPGPPADREQLARLWTREAALSGAALYVGAEDAGTDGGERVSPHVAAFLALLDAPVAVGGGPGSAAERLAGRPLRLRAGALSPGERREHARRELRNLASLVEPSAGWDDLVLSAPELATLRQLTGHVRHEELVNEQWGFAARHPRGLALTALFAGPSGTGKTMAAEVIAAELGLDLYRIDLATVVSKYIGETEKHLREIFAAAAGTGAVLLFDEADAIFGKRSEVRDSHDRYANLEVSYLLQQMEAYRGAAILTTNQQHAIDQAFMRRLRFVVQFPFPDPAARARIWRGIFPAATPVGDLDYDGLGQLTVTGGVIRNIATHAAFLAAGDGRRVEARHIMTAVRTEYAKLDKPLTAAETRGLA